MLKSLDLSHGWMNGTGVLYGLGTEPMMGNDGVTVWGELSVAECWSIPYPRPHAAFPILGIASINALEMDLLVLRHFWKG